MRWPSSKIQHWINLYCLLLVKKRRAVGSGSWTLSEMGHKKSSHKNCSCFFMLHFLLQLGNKGVIVGFYFIIHLQCNWWKEKTGKTKCCSFNSFWSLISLYQLHLSQTGWKEASRGTFHIFNDAVICAAYLYIARMLNPGVKNINVDTIESKVSVQQVQFYRLEIAHM